jgi:hypothetical protein
MKVFALLLLFVVTSASAQSSKVIPVFLDAVKIYLQTDESFQKSSLLKPEVRKIIQILDAKKISKAKLSEYLIASSQKSNWPLPADDEFDRWEKSDVPHSEVPEVALQAFKFDVVEESDDWFNDDIYLYFFVTDGVIPTGKVTGIYKGLDEGQSFFLNEVDRAIFPLMGIPAKRPDNHLIVDYGIVESDGDDIKELQKLSSVLVDIAIAVYTSIDPQNSTVIINLRKEIKALADLLLSLNHDDRLVTGSFGYKAADLTTMFGTETYVEFDRTHKKSSNFDSWEYIVHFRLLRK